MPNVGSLLREEITRVSRREIRKETQNTKKITAQHRHHIATLNRKVLELERSLSQLVRQASRHRSSAIDSDQENAGRKMRFVAKGLRSHRTRLGLSATDFGKLVGASANSIYAWESGATAPRRQHVVKMAQLRGIGKREALQRLAVLTGNQAPLARKR